mmetsp:Transcript_22373/g.72008  ORF Transcript_22373/g.72008 Transcript_22373/m.72008 type:complete len:275 (+) Transcript_22373:963-1787(+)
MRCRMRSNLASRSPPAALAAASAASRAGLVVALPPEPAAPSSAPPATPASTGSSSPMTPCARALSARISCSARCASSMRATRLINCASSSSDGASDPAGCPYACARPSRWAASRSARPSSTSFSAPRAISCSSHSGLPSGARVNSRSCPRSAGSSSAASTPALASGCSPACSPRTSSSMLCTDAISAATAASPCASSCAAACSARATWARYMVSNECARMAGSSTSSCGTRRERGLSCCIWRYASAVAAALTGSHDASPGPGSDGMAGGFWDSM